MQLNMIKQMERHARQNADVISLGQGIPGDRSPEYIREFVAKALLSESDIDVYSDPLGLPILRESIVCHLERDGMNYSADEIIVTSGAIEGINATLLTLLNDSKDEVIVPSPSYSAYSRAVHVARGKVVDVPLDSSKNWNLNIELVKQAITTRTAAVLICNPNNPTGNIYPKATLEALCKLAKKHNFIVIIDEVYGNMIYDDAVLYSPATDPCFREHVVRVVSFSKDFNLTGWRIGFLHSDQSLVEQILPVHDTLVNCAAVPSQYAALAALEIAPDMFAANLQAYTLKRKIMQQYLDSLAGWCQYSVPAGGYFFFVKLPADLCDQEFCHELATNAKLVAVPGTDFGKSGYVRLCFGRREEDIHKGMSRLRSFVEQTMPVLNGSIKND